jgi:hypothetical protein
MNERLANPQLPPVHVAVHCELIVRDSTMAPGTVPPNGNPVRDVPSSSGAVKDSIEPEAPIDTDRSDGAHQP